MRNFFVSLLCFMSISGCNSSDESRGINAIIGFYGGRVNYSKGVILTTDNTPSGRYYTIELLDAKDKIDKYFTSYTLPASNCAYLFYQELTHNEKSEYSFIRITIKGDKTNSTYNFACTDLAQVEKGMKLIENIIPYFKKSDYDKIFGKGNLATGSKQEWAKAKSLFSDVDQQYGSVTGFILQGFDFINRNTNGGSKRLVRLSGILVRKQQNTDFTFVVDPKEVLQNRYLYGFSFSKRLIK